MVGGFDDGCVLMLGRRLCWEGVDGGKVLMVGGVNIMGVVGSFIGGK